MIPRTSIVAWRSVAPWLADSQVEQDLVLSRVLVEVFSNSTLAENLAFRGGTALYKLHFRSAWRYSEDIDFVQIQSGAIGVILREIRRLIDPLLGNPTRDLREGSVVLNYRFSSEIPPVARLRLKMKNRNFLRDTEGLLRPGITYDPQEGFRLVENRLINLI